MKNYRVIDRTSFPRQRPEPKTPTMSFTRLNGVVYISLPLCGMLDLHPGDHIEFIKDDDTPLSLGIRKTDNQNGFRLRTKHHGLCFTSMSLANAVLQMWGKPKSFTARLLREPKDGIVWVDLKCIDRR